MVSTDLEKMAPVLDHIVEIEGIQDSLYGILTYVRSSMFHKTLKAGLLQTVILMVLELIIIGIDPAKMVPALNHVVENESTQCH